MVVFHLYYVRRLFGNGIKVEAWKTDRMGLKITNLLYIMEQIKAQHATQPFFVVNDEAYERMMDTLKNKSVKSVKSYIRVCPHKNKADCRCEFYENYLDDDGMMVRKVGGVIKPVFKLSDLKS